MFNLIRLTYWYHRNRQPNLPLVPAVLDALLDSTNPVFYGGPSYHTPGDKLAGSLPEAHPGLADHGWLYVGLLPPAAALELPRRRPAAGLGVRPPTRVHHQELHPEPVQGESPSDGS